MRRGANAGTFRRDRAGFAGAFGAIARAPMSRVAFASSQQPARRSGRRLPQIHAAQRLRPPQQPIDEKVHGRRLREEADVRDRIPRQVAAGPEAADARRRNACVGSDRRAIRPPTARRDRWPRRRTDRCRRPGGAAACHPSVGSWPPTRSTHFPAARVAPECRRSARRRRPSNADPEDRPTRDWPATPGRWRRTPRRS